MFRAAPIVCVALQYKSAIFTLKSVTFEVWHFLASSLGFSLYEPSFYPRIFELRKTTSTIYVSNIVVSLSTKYI